MMKHPKMMILLGCALCALPTVAAAENVSILPPGWAPPGWESDPLTPYDFGAVPLGDSASAIFEVHSLGPTPLMVTSVAVIGDPSGAFAITDIPPLPPELMPDDWFGVEVTFTPPSAGLFEAEFQIVSNDRETPVVRGPLTGGVVPEPGTFAVWSVLIASGIGIAWWRRRRE